MKCALARPFALAVLLSALALRTQAQVDEAARLVPADATILVRFQSFQDAVELVHDFAPLGGETPLTLDVATLLTMMQVPGDHAAIDAARPVYLALAIDPNAMQPATTWVLPVRDAAGFQRPLAELDGLLKAAVLGGYVGVSMAPNYAASAAPSPLAARLRPGIAAVHLDLATLVALYRPLIDMGLDMAESELAAMASQPGAMPQMQPLLEAYLEAGRTILDSAEALDVALEVEGRRLAFRTDFVAKAGSELDGWTIESGADLAQLAGCIDPTASMQFLSNASLGALIERFESMISVVTEIYPEPFRGEMERLVQMQSEVAALLEPGLAASFDFGDNGVRGTYVLRSSKPAEVLAKLETVLGGMGQPGAFVRFSAPERLSLGGIDARSWQMTPDYDALQSLVDAMAVEQGAAGAVAFDREEFRRLMAAMYGENLRLTAAHFNERVALIVSAEDDVLAASLAWLQEPATPSPDLARAVQRLEPGAAGFVYRIDFARMMSGVMDAAGAMIPGPIPDFPDQPFAFDFWGAVHGRTWSGGIATNMDELLDFVDAMSALEK